MSAPRPYHAGRPYKRARQRLKDEGTGICWICGLGINPDLPPNHNRAWSLDHVVSPLVAPDLALDPDNHREAHRDCNSSRGAGRTPPTPKQSRQWY